MQNSQNNKRILEMYENGNQYQFRDKARMSQNNLDDVSMLEEKPSSVREFITGSRSVRNEPHSSNSSFLPQYPSTNLFKTFVSTPSIEEQTSQLPRPANLDQNSYPFCQLEQRSSLETWEDGRIDLSQSWQGECFQCNCSWNQSVDCPLCLNARQVKGNSNIIKFFQYVIAFKMGNAPSYNNHSLSWQCNDRSTKYSTKKPKKSLNNSRVSDSSVAERASIRSKKFARSEFAREITNCVAVHQNYCCDLCQKTPIVGSRYHCSQCDDYDECQQCHRGSDHKHLMEKVERSGRERQLQNMVHILDQPLGKKSSRAPSIKYLTGSCIPSRNYY